MRFKSPKSGRPARNIKNSQRNSIPSPSIWTKRPPSARSSGASSPPAGTHRQSQCAWRSKRARFGPHPPLGLGVDDLRWLAPVRPYDLLHLEGEVVELTPSRSKPQGQHGTNGWCSMKWVQQLVRRHVQSDRRNCAAPPRSSIQCSFLAPVSGRLRYEPSCNHCYIVHVEPSRGAIAASAAARTGGFCVSLGEQKMPTYKAPVSDTLFLLSDVFDYANYANLPGFADAPMDVVEAILSEGGEVLRGGRCSRSTASATSKAASATTTAPSPRRRASRRPTRRSSRAAGRRSRAIRHSAARACRRFSRCLFSEICDLRQSCLLDVPGPDPRRLRGLMATAPTNRRRAICRSWRPANGPAR